MCPDMDITHGVSVVLLLLLSILSLACCGGDESNLIASLLNNYGQNARPPPSSNVTTVNLRFWLLSLDEFDERQQELMASAILELVWTDKRLAWNTSEYSVKYIALPITTIWKPDLALSNSAGSVYNSDFYQDFYKVHVTSEGLVTWSSSGQFTVSCTVDLTLYPFDTQSCYFRFENWIYTQSMVDTMVTNSSFITDRYAVSGEWSLLNTNITKESRSYGSNGPYSNIFMYIVIKRKDWYYVLNIVIPCVFLSVLMLFTFLLPHESGEKITLIITILLAFSVFQLTIANNIPKTSDFTPLLSNYLTFVMLTTGAALLATIFILKTATHAGNAPVPPALRKVTRVLGRVLCMVSQKETQTFKPVRWKETMKKHNGTHTNDINVVELNGHTNGDLVLRRECNGMVDDNGKDRSVTVCTNLPHDHDDSPAQLQSFHSTEPRNHANSSQEANAISSDLDEIIHYLEILHNNQLRAEQSALYRQEWDEASRIWDRAMLVLFSVVICVASVLFMAILPQLSKST